MKAFLNLHLIGYNFIVLTRALHLIGYKIKTCLDSNFAILSQYRFHDKGFFHPVEGVAKSPCCDYAIKSYF